MTLAEDILHAAVAKTTRERLATEKKEALERRKREARAKKDVPIIKSLIEKTCRKNLESGSWVIWGSFELDDIRTAAKELDLLVRWHNKDGFGIDTDWYREGERAVDEANGF